MTIYCLGSNGFIPTFGRQTACYAFKRGKRLIILDAGSGFFRFVEPIGRELLDGVNDIHLYLSHYHLDHTFGFYAALQILQGIPVTVFGMEKRKVYTEFPKMGYFPINYESMSQKFTWKKLDEGTTRFDDYSVAVRRQSHRGEGSLAFRFDFGLAYVTDSEPTNESIAFVQNAPLLLHEHGQLGEEGLGQPIETQIIGGHVTTNGAALVAREAKVSRLVLIHHDPFYDDTILGEHLVRAKSVFYQTTLAEDTKTIQL